MDVINEKNEVIDSLSRPELREKNLLHRSAIIFLFNSKGELFVHKRASCKYSFPSHWDMTIGGGVISGEEYEKAAQRELLEETNISEKIKFLFDFRFKSDTDNFIGKVFTCVSDDKVSFPSDEISEGKFMSIKALKTFMKKEKFCPDSIKVFEKYMKKN